MNPVPAKSINPKADIRTSGLFNNPTFVICQPPIKPELELRLPLKVPLVAFISPVTDKEEPFQTSLFPEGLPIRKVPPLAFVKKKPSPVLKS